MVFTMNFVLLSPLVLAVDPTPAPSNATGLDLGTSISPVKFIFDVNLGETATGEMTMYNVTNRATYLYPYTKNFKSDGSTGIPQFIEEALPFTNSLKD